MSDFFKKYKRRPRKEEYYNKYNLSCPRTIKKYYGSIDNLFRECGEHVPITIKEVTREDIIRQINDFYKREGRVPVKEEFILSNDLPTISHIKKYFSGEKIKIIGKNILPQLFKRLSDTEIETPQANKSEIDMLKKENYEKAKIKEALEIANGNKTMAASILNIDRKTLYNKIKLYKVDIS